jgi:hypothetical protein
VDGCRRALATRQLGAEHLLDFRRDLAPRLGRDGTFRSFDLARGLHVRRPRPRLLLRLRTRAPVAAHRRAVAIGHAGNAAAAAEGARPGTAVTLAIDRRLVAGAAATPLLRSPHAVVAPAAAVLALLAPLGEQVLRDLRLVLEILVFEIVDRAGRGADRCARHADLRIPHGPEGRVLRQRCDLLLEVLLVIQQRVAP